MSRFNAQLISTGATPSARRLQRILNARAVSPASTASASANTSKRLLFATDSRTSASSTASPAALEREPFDLLVRGEQIAFHALGERLRGRRRELELRGRRALLHPARQLRSLDRPNLDEHAVLLDRLHPSRALRGRIELLARADQEQPIGIVALGERRDHTRARVAGPRRRHPELDDLARREQRQVVGLALELGPAEAAIDDVQLARREPAAARRDPNLLERLVDEQRLVAGDEVHLRKTAGELTLELATRDFQAGPSSCESAMA